MTNRINAEIYHEGAWLASARFTTITAAREWAEGFGTLADKCVILKAGRLVAMHCRDPNGGGTRWFKADTGA
jgi:hypothetical protein